MAPASDGQIARHLRHAEIARGLVLVVVFHAHVLYGVVEPSMRGAWLQLKVLAPAVALFFTLSGVSSRSLSRKSASTVLAQSLFLQLLAIFSHVCGFLLVAGFSGEPSSVSRFLVELLEPIAYGTGYVTFVAWFFTVLAATRLVVYGLSRYRTRTLALLLAFALLAALAQHHGHGDNVYEWRNFPASIVLFYLGTKLPRAWQVPHWLGVAAFAGAVTLALINTPSLPERGPCFNCEPEFVAQPVVGEFGFLPVYAAYVVLAFVFLHWLAAELEKTRLGNAFKFFGRASLQILLLHGWVLITVYGPLLRHLPRWDSAWYYLLLGAGNMALHAVLYLVFRRPLNAIVRIHFTLSRRLIGAIAR